MAALDIYDGGLDKLLAAYWHLQPAQEGRLGAKVRVAQGVWGLGTFSRPLSKFPAQTRLRELSKLSRVGI